MILTSGGGSKPSCPFPLLGCGVGLRNVHYPVITRDWPQADWFEAVSENFMDSGGRPLRVLEQVRERYPVVLHGTSLSIGSMDPLRPEYLKRLKALVDRIEPAMVSDHLCWTSVEGEELHDLLPLPYTEEALEHVAGRVGQIQDLLGRPILLENVSTYLTYRHSQIPEEDFLSEVARRSGCGILLDLNNLYVNAFNHEFDPSHYLDRLSGEAVGYIHLAGHTDKGSYLFDTHSDHVIDPVWQMYEELLARWGRKSTLIEWDEKIPEFPVLLAEAQKAKGYYDKSGDISLAKELAVIPARLKRGSETADPRLKISGMTTPHDLLTTQRWFKSIVRPAAQFSSFQVPLNRQRGTPGEERLGIYAEGYLGRIHESLCEVYEAVRHLVGHGTFLRLAEIYANRYPSRHYNLTQAGISFPEFLKSHPETQSFPFLPDLARLEWNVMLSFHAFDREPLSPQALGQVSPDDWENSRLSLQPSVRLVRSSWPILDLWAVRKTPLEKISIRLENRPQFVLIHREGTNVLCENLEPPSFFILERISEGHPLGEIFEQLVEQDLGSAQPVQNWFSQWTAQGLFLEKIPR